jgi:hypothetical protein
VDEKIVVRSENFLEGGERDVGENVSEEKGRRNNSEIEEITGKIPQNNSESLTVSEKSKELERIGKRKISDCVMDVEKVSVVGMQGGRSQSQNSINHIIYENLMSSKVNTGIYNEQSDGYKEVLPKEIETKEAPVSRVKSPEAADVSVGGGMKYVITREPPPPEKYNSQTDSEEDDETIDENEDEEVGGSDGNNNISSNSSIPGIPINQNIRNLHHSKENLSFWSKNRYHTKNEIKEEDDEEEGRDFEDLEKEDKSRPINGKMLPSLNESVFGAHEFPTNPFAIHPAASMLRTNIAYPIYYSPYYPSIHWNPTLSRTRFGQIPISTPLLNPRSRQNLSIKDTRPVIDRSTFATAADLRFVNNVEDVGNKRKCETEINVKPSKKRGVKHDPTSVHVYVEKAKQVNDYNTTGLADHKKFVVIHEDLFYKWVCGIKDAKYSLEKASLLEKFDKSRRTNRVNPKDKTGKIPIKYLRIDRSSRNGAEFMNRKDIEKDLEEIDRRYGTNHIRVITHRDWGYLDEAHFVYEAKKSS